MNSNYGIKIPVEYITPNMMFYPGAIPVVILGMNGLRHFNKVKENIKNNNSIMMTYNKMSQFEKIDFIKLLMYKLNRKYFIVDNFLIDYGNYNEHCTNKLKLNVTNSNIIYEDKKKSVLSSSQ